MKERKVNQYLAYELWMWKKRKKNRKNKNKMIEGKEHDSLSHVTAFPISIHPCDIENWLLTGSDLNHTLYLLANEWPNGCLFCLI